MIREYVNTKCLVHMSKVNQKFKFLTLWLIYFYKRVTNFRTMSIQKFPNWHQPNLTLLFVKYLQIK